MGGTSTDVTHYAGEYERAFVTEVAGVRLRAPMMRIHTVAAGGGSICAFDGSRLRVGPESAGANPGPASYRRGGPLTVTDCNVMVGKLSPDLFPRVFGPGGDEPLDRGAVQARFAALAVEVGRATGRRLAPEEIADGFLRIAVENMANAIKHISVERGHDVTGYTLCCFGGAGGQHACRVADALGMTRVLVHPLAGVLCGRRRSSRVSTTRRWRPPARRSTSSSGRPRTTSRGRASHGSGSPAGGRYTSRSKAPTRRSRCPGRRRRRSWRRSSGATASSTGS
jgi:5-oxoprolinase (ATP-hydrolysing)